MGKNIEERTFYMGKGRCILPSLDKLKENMFDEVAKIIYHSAKIVFFNDKNIKDNDYEMDVENNSITYFIDNDSNSVIKAIKFYYNKNIPMLFAHTQKFYNFVVKPTEIEDYFYLIYQFKYLEFMFCGEPEREDALKILITGYRKGIYPMYPNFRDVYHDCTEKYYDGIYSFSKLLCEGGRFKKLLFLSEKACLDVFG